MKIKLRNRMWLFLIVLISVPLQVMAESADSTDLAEATESAEVGIYGTQVHHLYSEVIGEEYQVFVHLPPSYEEGEKRYPVLYLTDGDLLFGIAANVARLNQLRGDIPDFIIAGIAYGVYETDARNHRARDFLAEVPEDSDWEPGADKFLQFLRTELVPYMNDNFRTDPADLAVWGTSFGGNFGIYALFHEQPLFNRFVISSPATAWADRWAFRYESAYAETRSDLKARVFFSVGELELEWMVEPYKEFTAIVEGRNYAGLSMRSTIEPGEWHQSMPAAVFAKSLKYIFAKE